MVPIATRFSNWNQAVPLADQCGIIKDKAADVVLLLYDFYPVEAFNSQLEEANFISTAIESLLHHGAFIRDGCDEQGRANNFTHPAIKILTIFIYKRVENPLSAEFENNMSYKIVALAAAVIKCCLDEWKSGRQEEIRFTLEEYGPTYDAVLALIEKLKENPYHWNKFTAARRAWAVEAIQAK